jgi:hypothetical protein
LAIGLKTAAGLMPTVVRGAIARAFSTRVVWATRWRSPLLVAMVDLLNAALIRFSIGLPASAFGHPRRAPYRSAITTTIGRRYRPRSQIQIAAIFAKMQPVCKKWGTATCARRDGGRTFQAAAFTS